MMKKAVPLSVLLASSALGQNLYSGVWTVPTTPNTPSGNCCYYTGPVTVTPPNSGNVQSSTISGTTSTTGSAAAVSGGAPASGPCGQQMSGASPQITTTNSVSTWAQTLGTLASGVYPNSVGPAGNQDAGGSWLVGTDGLTLSFTPSANAAAAASCTAQVFNRQTAVIANLGGTVWSTETGTGTNAASCCFYDGNVAFTDANSRTSASGKNVASANCASLPGGNGGTGTTVLKAGTTTGTATDLSGVRLFTLNSDGTATYTPATGCTQKLTKVNSSNGVHLASIMTPVVVGGAMFGLMAL